MPSLLIAQHSVIMSRNRHPTGPVTTVYMSASEPVDSFDKVVVFFYPIAFFPRDIGHQIPESGFVVIYGELEDSQTLLELLRLGNEERPIRVHWDSDESGSITQYGFESPGMPDLQSLQPNFP